MTDRLVEPGRDHAIVIGSGMAGLMAARVLADHFERVTLVEKDASGLEAHARKGVPQGAFLHLLLKRGEHVLEELFPGIADELAARGATVADSARDVRWFHHHVWKVRYESGLSVHVQTRPFLEALVRERVHAIDGVDRLYGYGVIGLDIESSGRVTGVRLDARPGGAPERLAADLVVDASGRGSRLPAWLVDHGYVGPRETQAGVGLEYATRLYRQPPGGRDWKLLIVYATPPDEKRGGAIFTVENGLWHVNLYGIAGERVPRDNEGFVEYTRSLPRPDVYEAIREAEPVSDTGVFGFPQARWRRYEKLRAFPRGLLALGDAVCSFDPIFGQGMSTAAQGAMLLRDELARDHGPDARRFFRKLARTLDTPWRLATLEDFRYPGVTGRRPAGIRPAQWYIGRVFRHAAHDPCVYERLLRVFHLIERPRSLFAPGVARRVLAAPPAVDESPLQQQSRPSRRARDDSSEVP